MAVVAGKNLDRAHPELRSALQNLADSRGRNLWCQSVGRTDEEQQYYFDGFQRRKAWRGGYNDPRNPYLSFNPANPPGGASRHRFKQGICMATAADMTPGWEYWGKNPAGPLHAPIVTESWHFQLERQPANLWIPAGAGVSALRKGFVGARVKALQEQLNFVAAANLVVDSSFGDSTEAAVKAFQVKTGLVADGVVGTATQAKLDAESMRILFELRFTYNRYAGRPTVGPGARGDDVKILQEGLVAAGQNVTVDSSYGPQTTLAIQNVQRFWGLFVDGICGEKTWAQLDFVLDHAGK